MRRYTQKGGCGNIEYLVLRSAHTKWMAPNKYHGIRFVRWSDQALEHHHQQGKCCYFLSS